MQKWTNTIPMPAEPLEPYAGRQQPHIATKQNIAISGLCAIALQIRMFGPLCIDLSTNLMSFTAKCIHTVLGITNRQQCELHITLKSGVIVRLR